MSDAAQRVGAGIFGIELERRIEQGDGLSVVLFFECLTGLFERFVGLFAFIGLIGPAQRRHQHHKDRTARPSDRRHESSSPPGLLLCPTDYRSL